MNEASRARLALGAARVSGGRRSVANLWCEGFRPFFLAASIWAAAALAIWITVLVTGWQLPTRFAPIAWHSHEMLFGFVMAAAAGFLLTALPTWMGRPPVQGASLAVLAGLWLLGRAACLVSALVPPAVTPIIDLSFTVGLVLVIANEIMAARNYRLLAMAGVLVILGVANGLMHLEALGFAVPAGIGWRLGIACMVILISVIAGRLVPSFMRNWLAKRGRDLMIDRHWRERLSIFALHAGIVAWVFMPASRVVGIVLVIGGALQLWRLLRWRGTEAAAEPLLFILHVGYAWLVAGVLLLGAAALAPAVPASAAIHALTAGAMGTMILAVMTRATRGHTGRELAADQITTLIYLLITAAALARVAAPFSGVLYFPLILTAGAGWIGAFTIFAVRYGPWLMEPRTT